MTNEEIMAKKAQIYKDLDDIKLLHKAKWNELLALQTECEHNSIHTYTDENIAGIKRTGRVCDFCDREIESNTTQGIL